MRAGEAGETRKGLRADFGAQFDTHRCIARLVWGFFPLFAQLVESGDLNNRLNWRENLSCCVLFHLLETGICAAMIRDAIVHM